MNPGIFQVEKDFSVFSELLLGVSIFGKFFRSAFPFDDRHNVSISDGDYVEFELKKWLQDMKPKIRISDFDTFSSADSIIFQSVSIPDKSKESILKISNN